jgi:hypothetical protein
MQAEIGVESNAPVIPRMNTHFPAIRNLSIFSVASGKTVHTEIFYLLSAVMDCIMNGPHF